MRAAFDRRRLTMTKMLNEIHGVQLPAARRARSTATRRSRGCSGRPIAGRVAQTTAELAGILLEEADVAVVPGEAFGTPGYFRLSCALGDADLEEGISRIAALVARLPASGLLLTPGCRPAGPAGGCLAGR